MKRLSTFISSVSGAINSMLDDVVICDKDGVIQFANTNFLKSSGLNIKQVRQKQVNKVIGFAPFSKPSVLFNTDDVLIKTVRVRNDKGKIVDRTAVLCKIITAEMKYDGFLIVFSKLSDELREARADFEKNKILSVINHRKDAVWFCSDVINKATVYITDTIESICGWTIEEFCSGGWTLFLSLIHPDDLNGLIDSHGKWLNQKNKFGTIIDHTPFHTFVRFRCRDTSYMRMDVEYNVLKRENDKVSMIFGSYRPLPDNTEINRDVFRQIDGKTFVDLEFLKKIQKKSLAPHDTNPSLTQREKEVMSLLVNGHSTEEIASQLHISKHTVNTHRKQIIRKLGAKNLADLVKKYLSLQ